MRISKHRFWGVVVGLLVAVAAPRAHAIVVEIGLADFENPLVVDFETAALGPIAGNDPIFTNAGISSVTPTPIGADVDDYQDRANSSRALGANSSGLLIAAPGAADVADTNLWQIDFASPITRFGFGVHDQNVGPSIALTFFLNNVQVGTFSFASGSSDLDQRYFDSTVAFNALTIEQSSGSSGNLGFMLDNLTVDVPEPGTLALFGVGLVGLGVAARRRRRAA